MNMMLLATYMKRKGWDYEEATNGLIALEAFENRPHGFDVIFMGTFFHPVPPSHLIPSHSYLNQQTLTPRCKQTSPCR